MSLSITRELVLAQARTLARSGRHGEAVELLEDLQEKPSVTVLDLLARIHAQQGDLDRADQCWAEAERLAPGGAEIAAGRRRIAAMRPAARRRGLGKGLLATCTVLVTGAVLVLLVDIRLETAGLRMSQQPAALPTGREVAAPPTVVTISPPEKPDVLARMRLDVPGIRVRRSPGEISIVFEEALFSQGTELTRRGQAVLDGLGGRLRPYANEIDVAVVGHTDRDALLPGGEYVSNTDLGLARATYVREILRTTSRIPTTRFALSSLGGVMPPYRDDARNRTVTLRISGAAG
ncbi:OmpA family protein [Nonomuraea sp. NPDC049625]|uniref:OmpA family protein n=1 Tax=Nonomuraea sp. NPDC049625 TaxID=3155775 RepID=UPI00342DF290